MFKTQRTDLAHDLRWCLPFTSMIQKNMIHGVLPIMNHLLRLLINSSDTKVGLAQLDFWIKDFTLLEQQKEPLHPLTKKLYFLKKKYLTDFSPLFFSIEAISWQLMKISLSTEQDLTNYCLKLSSYLVPILFKDYQYGPAQQQILDELRILIIKIHMVQWFTFDKQFEMSMIPAIWHDAHSNPSFILRLLLKSCAKHLNAIDALLEQQTSLSLVSMLLLSYSKKIYFILNEQPELSLSHVVVMSYRSYLYTTLSTLYKYQFNIKI